MTVVVLAALLATGPIGAHASDGDIDHFTYVGNTCGLSPAVQLVGGTGNFFFVTTDNSPVPGLCSGESTDTTPPETAPPNSCSITASGSYSSTVCGTGSASGTSSTTESDGSGEIGVPFSITFVAGVGEVQGGFTGVVHLLPTSPASPPACVTGFTVYGAVTITN